MRASYLAPDRADMGDAVENLAEHMQSPKQVEMARLKRLARYLKGGLGWCRCHAGASAPPGAVLCPSRSWWTATTPATRSADGSRTFLLERTSAAQSAPARAPDWASKACWRTDRSPRKSRWRRTLPRRVLLRRAEALGG
eukprot:7420581-Pyramimonas_sp.AAC.2